MQAKPLNAPASKKAPTLVRYFLILLFLCFLTLISYPIFKKILDVNSDIQEWNTLRNSSPLHQKLVSSYMECRVKLIGRGTVAECLLQTRQYSEIQQIDKATTETILREIVSKRAAVIRPGD